MRWIRTNFKLFVRPRPGGADAAGLGALQRVEGIIDHHLLELHHVRDLPAHVPLYDWAFLLVRGVLLGAAGWWMSRPKRARTVSTR
jgi:uncharacterized membrane protein